MEEKWKKEISFVNESNELNEREKRYSLNLLNSYTLS